MGKICLKLAKTALVLIEVNKLSKNNEPSATKGAVIS